MKHGDFTHIETPADDPERARRFYSELFGWTFAPPVPGFEGYHMFTTPAGEARAGGAIGTRGEMAPERLRTYVHVVSIEESLARVEELGGTVVEGRSDVQGRGGHAVHRDPAGDAL